MHAHHRGPICASRFVALAVAAALVTALAGPLPTLAIQEGETQWIPQDTDGNGVTDTWAVDWDGDGQTDEVWQDTNEDGTIDEVVVIGGDASHSARGIPGKTKVTPIPISTGGDAVGIDWNGDGKYDEYWWDFDGDGAIEDADIKHTESKILDNTGSTRFRGVFVGVNNGLEWAEQDVEDLTEALENHPESWGPSDTTSLTGAAATPAAIQGAINAAKAAASPGDEFVFYFSGHGGGYHKDKGYKGGVIDADGDETAIVIRERDFEADGSKLTTPAVAGRYNATVWDTDGDGSPDRGVTKDSNGLVEVRVINPGPPMTVGPSLGADTNGDNIVDGADGGVDINNDGDKDDSFAVDDTLIVAGGAKITDDQLVTWLSGFPESCTIVVILDSCFSGSFVPDLRRVKDKDGKLLRPGHLEAVTGAAADSFAYEEPISNGVLTQGILNALAVVDADGTPGGHTTSVADKASGAPDDITTTAELFSFAGPQATTYHVGDEDGDGLTDEDSFTHDYTSIAIDPAGVTPAVSTIVHGFEDPDGDGEENLDVAPPVESFFDVYFAAPYDMRGTPRFRQTFGGDTALSLTGMQPGFGAHSEVAFLPGAPTAVQIEVLQVPMSETPEPMPGMSYASECYDVSVWLANITPALDDDDLTGAMYDLLPVVAGWGPTTASIGVGEWVPGLAPDPIPAWYNESLPGWVPLPPLPFDPAQRSMSFMLEHTSMFALFYPGPGPSDSDAPLPPTRLTASRAGLDAQLVWSNPTDPDFESTLIYRSASGFASSPMGGTGQTQVYGGKLWYTTDTGVDVGGSYFYTAYSRDTGGMWSDRATATLDMGTAETPVQGDDRFATALAASNAAFPNGLAHEDAEGHLSAIVATGRNWPDALGASALAGAVHGPILLTEPGSLPAAVADEIDRLGADRIFIVGGTAAVSNSVETAILARPGVETAERLAGDDRYLTAEAVAERTVDLLGGLTGSGNPDGLFDGTVFIATGTNFPDALAASPLAFAKGWPLLLSGAGGLSDSTKSTIADIGATGALVLGGEQAVPSSVVTYLGGEMPSVMRLFGDNRYETAVDVATYGFEDAGLHLNGLGLATGENYPDALSGGVLVGQRGSVMVLTPSAALSPVVAAMIEAQADDITEVIFFGGYVALSDDVRADVFALLH